MFLNFKKILLFFVACLLIHNCFALPELNTVPSAQSPNLPLNIYLHNLSVTLNNPHSLTPKAQEILFKLNVLNQEFASHLSRMNSREVETLLVNYIASEGVLKDTGISNPDLNLLFKQLIENYKHSHIWSSHYKHKLKTFNSQSRKQLNEAKKKSLSLTALRTTAFLTLLGSAIYGAQWEYRDLTVFMSSVVIIYTMLSRIGLKDRILKLTEEVNSEQYQVEKRANKFTQFQLQFESLFQLLIGEIKSQNPRLSNCTSIF